MCLKYGLRPYFKDKAHPLEVTGLCFVAPLKRHMRALQAAEKLNSLKGTAFRPSVSDCNYVRL
jgi:hypothetical protein